MNLLTAAAIASLGVVGFLVTRTVLFPGVVFAGVWAAVLLLLQASGDVFYPISDAARSVFLGGAAAFLLGALSGWLMMDRRVPPPARRVDCRAVAVGLDLFLAALVVAIPAYWAELQRIARELAIESILQAARLRALEAGTGAGRGIPAVLSNLVQMSILATYLALAVDATGTRWTVRRVALFGLALVYQVSTGSRGGAAALVVGAVGVSAIRTGRVPWRTVLPATAALLAVFALVAIQLEKGFVRRDLGLRANLPALVADLQWYALAGVTGFDHVAREPTDVPSTGGFTRGVRELAMRFGADGELPSLHAHYRTVGDARQVNVYSAYFAYLPEGGLPATIILMAGAGLLCSVVFVAGQRGSLGGRVLYGIGFAGICQSIYNESFYTNVNFIAKTLLVLLLLYGIAGRPGDRPARDEPA